MRTVTLGGPITVHRTVNGDVIAVGGSVDVTGKVTGSVVAVGGPISLRPTAVVPGDVITVGSRFGTNKPWFQPRADR